MWDTIELSVIEAGQLWDGSEAWVLRNETFGNHKDLPFKYKWTGLRDALLRTLRYGDFQHSGIYDAYMTITSRDGNIKIERYAEIPRFSWIEDLFIPEDELDGWKFLMET